MTDRQPIGLAPNQTRSTPQPVISYLVAPVALPPLTLNQIIDHYQVGSLAKLPTYALQLAQRKVALYLAWHEQHPDFPFTMIPTASQLQPMGALLDATLNARYGLDGMTPLSA